SGLLGGEKQMISAAGGPVEGMIDATVVDGSLQPGEDSLVVSRSVARDKGWTYGTTVPLVGPDGSESTLRVTGVYEDSQVLGPFYTGRDVYERLVPENLRSTFNVLVTPARSEERRVGRKVVGHEQRAHGK